MFWNWFFFFVYSMGACAAISNTTRGKTPGDRFFKFLLATAMFMVAVSMGVMNVLTILEI